jgi:adenine-specific DNA methylase
MRVGVDAISNDYNPVAYLIQKATLEYPRKYGEKLYKDVKKGLEWVFEAIASINRWIGAMKVQLSKYLNV